MATEMENESYLEVYDIDKKESVARTPFAKVRFIPRSGERIFIALQGPGNWVSYTVLDVHYFLGYDSSTGKPARSGSEGVGRVTLYVEPSK
jgi:hypothetical protein